MLNKSIDPAVHTNRIDFSVHLVKQLLCYELVVAHLFGMILDIFEHLINRCPPYRDRTAVGPRRNTVGAGSLPEGQRRSGKDKARLKA